MSGTPLRIVAPAKLNLYLGVHDELDYRRYHRVDSVMVAVDLDDVVSIENADALHVACVPAASFPETANSAWRAATAMGEAFGHDPSYSIVIEKAIPARSGLGGASTDAAAVILGLCRLWGVDPTDARVASVARAIGADVPFFLGGAPTFLVGAGDTPEETFPPLEGLPVVLVKPVDGGISAGEAYAEFDRIPTEAASPEPMCQALRDHDVAAVASRLANNLDPVACRLMPSLSTLRDWLLGRAGVRAAMVTGSGSGMFAICSSDEEASAVAAEAGVGHGWWARATHTVGHGPVIEGA